MRTRFVEKLGEVDADKDGAVTVDEFAQTVPALDVGITVEEARAVFSLLDVTKAKCKHMLQCTCLFTHVISTRAPYVCVLAFKTSRIRSRSQTILTHGGTWIHSHARMHTTPTDNG